MITLRVQAFPSRMAARELTSVSGSHIWSFPVYSCSASRQFRAAASCWQVHENDRAVGTALSWVPRPPRVLTTAGAPTSMLDTELQQGTPTQISTKSLCDVRWEAITRRLELMGESSPQTSLNEGHWVKLICGASFEDVADVRNLALIYTLAGVDCIDCAADPAIVAAVKEGINAAKSVMQSLGSGAESLIRTPWIMISINDNEDPHFRKAEFNSDYCPVNCARPCERVCPALAIKFGDSDKGANFNHLEGGVIVERCYGCGRCLPVCPLGLISARSYVRPLETVANLIRSEDVDAVEIHTGAGHQKAFQDLMSQLGSSLTSLKLTAVSVPDLQESMIPALNAFYSSMQPFVKNLNLWQLDGRPMSGDIGAGATRAAVILAEKVVASQDRPPGYIQLAGGTNAYTATALKNVGLYGRMAPKEHGEVLRNQDTESSQALVAGVAYGGYARKIVHKFLKAMEEEPGHYEESKRMRTQLERHLSILADAVLEANVLVDGMKFDRRYLRKSKRAVAPRCNGRQRGSPYN